MLLYVHITIYWNAYDSTCRMATETNHMATIIDYDSATRITLMF